MTIAVFCGPIVLLLFSLLGVLYALFNYFVVELFALIVDSC